MNNEYEITEKIEGHLKEIMNLLELKVNASSEGTPHRVAKMWVNELFKNRNNRNLEELRQKMKLFPNMFMNDYIMVKDIEFNSMCEHHWLPFSGKVTVAYIPGENVIGLSKIPRVVRYFSQKPTLQEKLTKEVGDFLFDTIKPVAILVVAEATHMCVKCRGAESDCSTTTQYFRISDKEENNESSIKRYLEGKTAV